MDKGKKVNKPLLINSILLIVRLLLIILICEVYKQNTYIIERGYPATENTYFSISVGWLPIILSSVCLAANIVRLFLAFRRKQISYKTDALSLIAEMVVALFYTLPVLAFAKNFPTPAFKAAFITLCAVLAAFTLFRGVYYIMKTTFSKKCHEVKNVDSEEILES